MKALVLALFLVFASSVGSAMESQPREGIGNPDARNEIPEGEQKLAARLSGYLNVPEEELIALRMQGLGWGDVEMAFLVAKATDQPVAAIADLWADHQGNWETVGRVVGVDNVESLKAPRPEQPDDEDANNP